MSKQTKSRIYAVVDGKLNVLEAVTTRQEARSVKATHGGKAHGVSIRVLEPNFNKAKEVR